MRESKIEKNYLFRLRPKQRESRAMEGFVDIGWGHYVGFAANSDGAELSALIADHYDCVNRATKDLGDESDRQLGDKVTGADLMKNVQGNYWYQGGGFYKVMNRSGKIVAAGGITVLNSSLCRLHGIYVSPLVNGGPLIQWFFNYIASKASDYGFSKMKLDGHQFEAVSSSIDKSDQLRVLKLAVDSDLTVANGSTQPPSLKV